MALGLAREGAKVVLAEVREANAEGVQREIQSLGGTAAVFAGDLSQEQAARELVESCVRTFGRLDILINNAGLRMETHPDGVYEQWRCRRQRPTQDVPVEDWDQILAVNLRAVYLCTHFALPHMIRQNHGVIVGVSSNAGSMGVAGKSAYVASKHGVEGLMKTVAAEMREHNISANAIHPGGRVDVDGRGGASVEILVPLVLHLARQQQPDLTGQVLKAMDWNEARDHRSP
jgi:3-oxoacyl-[acyl-carrier protein] reductase